HHDRRRVQASAGGQPHPQRNPLSRDLGGIPGLRRPLAAGNRMTAQQALDLVARESLGEDGLPVVVRRGEEPDRERMAMLLGALRIVEKALRGQPTLDRKLACQLHALSFDVQGQVEGWLSRGATYTPEFLDELGEMFELIGYIFADVSFDPDH